MKRHTRPMRPAAEQLVCAVTGVSGYVGSKIHAHLQGKNIECYGLSSNPDLPGPLDEDREVVVLVLVAPPRSDPLHDSIHAFFKREVRKF